MTDNHKYNTPSRGAANWHEPLNENFRKIDTDIEVRDLEENRGQYQPNSGSKFLATDTGQVFIGDGQQWQPVRSTGTNPSFSAVRATQIHTSASEADSIIYSRGAETVAIDSEGEVARGENAAPVVQAAIDKHKRGRIVQASDITISDTIDVDVRVNYDGLGNSIFYPGDDWAMTSQSPADNIGASIGHIGGIKNVRLFLTGGGSGIRLRDITKNNYRNIHVKGKDNNQIRVGIEVTDENYWTENILFDNIHIRGYTEAGLRIGSADFDCRFESVSLNSKADNAIGLDMTNNIVAGSGENYIREVTFDNLMIWHRKMPNPSTSPAIRLDTHCRNVIFNKPQIHPQWGLTDVRVTPNASGDIVFRDPVMLDCMDGDLSELTIREEQQAHIMPSVGMSDDFGDNHVSHGRQGVKAWSDAGNCPVQHRPKWSDEGDGITKGTDEVVVPSGETLVRTGVFAFDENWGWRLRYSFDETPTNGPLIVTFWKDIASGISHQFRQNPGSCTIREATAEGSTRAMIWDSTPADTTETTITITRGRGGYWELYRDGMSVGRGSENTFPSGPTQFRVKNNSDASVRFKSLDVGPKAWVESKR